MIAMGESASLKKGGTTLLAGAVGGGVERQRAKFPWNATQVHFTGLLICS